MSPRKPVHLPPSPLLFLDVAHWLPFLTRTVAKSLSGVDHRGQEQGKSFSVLSRITEDPRALSIVRDGFVSRHGLVQP